MSIDQNPSSRNDVADQPVAEQELSDHVLYVIAATSGISSVIGLEVNDVTPPAEDSPGYLFCWELSAGRAIPFASLLWRAGTPISVLVSPEADNPDENFLADRVAGYCSRRGILCDIEDAVFGENADEDGDEDSDDDGLGDTPIVLN